MRVLFVLLVVVPLGFPKDSDEEYYSSPIDTMFARRFLRSDTPSLRDDDPKGLTPAERSCGGHESRNSFPAKNCETKKVEKSDCSIKGRMGCFLYSMTTRKAYMHCCPEMECFFITIPCPRKGWDKNVIPDFQVTCYSKEVAVIWHYEKKELKADTLYDMETNHMVDVNIRGSKEFVGIRTRFHTCTPAEPVTNLAVAAYGLGWVYFRWHRPIENCLTKIMYREEYAIENEIFGQNDVGDYVDRETGLYLFKKFHPCPDYPNWFCFIISENILPYHEIEFKVAYKRFRGEDDIDSAQWTKIKVKTDDLKQLIMFCPGTNFFLTLMFLIILIVVFLLLLLVAAILIGILMHRKKKEQRRKDMEDEPYEEETIPPASASEKWWERLKNFFATLCPRPKKPPPPPPAPPLPPPKVIKPKKKPKPKSKPKPKPKKKTPTPTPSPPPPPPPRRKGPRRAREEKRAGREAAAIDAKRAASAVGGGGGGRRRRPR